MIGVEKIAEVGIPVVYSSLGGVAHFLYRVSKEPEKWSTTMFVINVVLAGFVGFSIAGFLPASIQQNNQLFGSIMSISGFTTFPLLDFLEREGWKLLVKRLLNIK